jgi:NAD+ synthetase
MKLLEGTHVMIDLETYDTATTAVILSIGAVKFNKETIIDKFYVNVDTSSCLQYGLTISPDTVGWWEKQGEEARKVLGNNPLFLQDALIRFKTWYGDKSLPTWGNGSNFDNPIMEHAFQKTGIKCPWEFWHDRCFRTVNSMFGVKREFKGVKHYSLDDAIHQAEILMEINKSIQPQCKASCERRVSTLEERAVVESEYVTTSKRQTLVNCLSGGVDSTCSGLVSKKACPQGAIGLILPCSSESELSGERGKDIVDAQRVANHLDIPAVQINLSPLWEHSSRIYRNAAEEMSAKRGIPIDEKKLSWAINNIKPTLRLMSAGFFADAFDGLIIGTDNAIENFLGYFSIRGDGIADRQPIRDLTKGEVREMVACGDFPEDLVNRIPTAGLWPGQTDEDELGFTYNDADKLFVWLLEKHVDNLSKGGLMDETMTVKLDKVKWIISESSLPVSKETAQLAIAQNQRTRFKRKTTDLETVLKARNLI